MPSFQNWVVVLRSATTQVQMLEVLLYCALVSVKQQWPCNGTPHKNYTHPKYTDWSGKLKSLQQQRAATFSKNVLGTELFFILVLNCIGARAGIRH